MRFDLFQMAKYQWELAHSVVVRQYYRVRFYFNLSGEYMISVYHYMSDREEEHYRGRDEREAIRTFRLLGGGCESQECEMCMLRRGL
jgi:hypothetical protein